MVLHKEYSTKIMPYALDGSARFFSLRNLTLNFSKLCIVLSMVFQKNGPILLNQTILNNIFHLIRYYYVFEFWYQ